MSNILHIHVCETQVYTEFDIAVHSMLCDLRPRRGAGQHIALMIDLKSTAS